MPFEGFIETAFKLHDQTEGKHRRGEAFTVQLNVKCNYLALLKHNWSLLMNHKFSLKTSKAVLTDESGGIATGLEDTRGLVAVGGWTYFSHSYVLLKRAYSVPM